MRPTGKQMLKKEKATDTFFRFLASIISDLILTRTNTSAFFVVLSYHLLVSGFNHYNNTDRYQYHNYLVMHHRLQVSSLSPLLDICSTCVFTLAILAFSTLLTARMNISFYVLAVSSTLGTSWVRSGQLYSLHKPLLPTF